MLSETKILLLQKSMERLPIWKVPVCSTEGRGGSVHFMICNGFLQDAPPHIPPYIIHSALLGPAGSIRGPGTRMGSRDAALMERVF